MTKPPKQLTVLDRFDGGLTWTIAGESMLQCRAHALVTDDGDVWLVDPLDAPGLDELVEPLGPVRGVIVLLDRHLRQSVQVAQRHDARLVVPRGKWRPGHPMPEGAEQLAPGALDGTPFELQPLIERGGQWLEWLLWWQARRVLVVAEVVGTAPHYEQLDDGAGLHPALHVMGAPDTIAPVELHERIAADPFRLLLGHGELDRPAQVDEIDARLHGARRRLPKLALRTPKLAWQLWRTRRSGMRTGC